MVTPKKQAKPAANDVDDDTTQATTEASGDKSNTATAGHGNNNNEDVDVDEGGDRKKKRKKRANKRQVAQLKEVRKDFMERCVSPGYNRISRVQMNADLKFQNFKKVMEEEVANQEKIKNARLANAKAAAKGKKGAKKGMAMN